MSEETLSNLSREDRTFEPPAELAEHANVTAEAYARAAADPEAFWAEAAGRLAWHQKWDRVLDWDDPPFAKWFTGGKLNAAYTLGSAPGLRQPRPHRQCAARRRLDFTLSSRYGFIEAHSAPERTRTSARAGSGIDQVRVGEPVVDLRRRQAGEVAFELFDNGAFVDESLAVLAQLAEHAWTRHEDHMCVAARAHQLEALIDDVRRELAIPLIRC